MQFSNSVSVKLTRMAFAATAFTVSAIAHAQTYEYAPDVSVAPQVTYPQRTYIEGQPYYDNAGNLVYPNGYYVQPAPVYSEPEAVYVEPETVYVEPSPVYSYRRAPNFARPGWTYENRGREGDGDGRMERRDADHEPRGSQTDRD